MEDRELPLPTMYTPRERQVVLITTELARTMNVRTLEYRDPTPTLRSYSCSPGKICDPLTMEDRHMIHPPERLHFIEHQLAANGVDQHAVQSGCIALSTSIAPTSSRITTSGSTRPPKPAESVSITIDCEENVQPQTWQWCGSTHKVIKVHGSQVFHTRFEIDQSRAGEGDAGNLATQISHYMKIAERFDQNFTVQLGSFAVLKHTASGRKSWMLQENWTPTIFCIRRSHWRSWKVPIWRLYHVSTWTVRGFNLQGATLRAATTNQKEYLKDLYQHKMESGIDELICEESSLIKNSSMLQDKVHICASRSVEVEEGVTCTLQSEPQNVQKAYWISVVTTVVYGLTPMCWTLVTITSLSLLVGVTGIQPGLVSSQVDLQWGHNNLMAKLQFEENSTLSSIWRVLRHCGYIRGTWLSHESFVPYLVLFTISVLWFLVKCTLENPKVGLAHRPPPGKSQLNDSVWELNSSFYSGQPGDFGKAKHAILHTARYILLRGYCSLFMDELRIIHQWFKNDLRSVIKSFSFSSYGI